MKKIFTLSAAFILLSVMLISCVRDNNINNNNENYWLSKERGEVVYSDSYCNYYVVETYNGYTIVRAYFSAMGTRDMYDRSSGYVFTGTVTDYWLTYIEAQDALDYYCPLMGGKGAKREFKKSSFTK
jgi:hypothetical protein